MERIKCNGCLTILNLKDSGHLSCRCGSVSISFSDRKINVNGNLGFDWVDESGFVVYQGKQKTEYPSRKEMLDELDFIIKSFVDLPKNGMINPINHYDFSSVMMLVSAILRSDAKD